MAKINVLLVCCAGASTGMIVVNMISNLKEDENCRIEAKPFNEIADTIGKYDFVMVAPQMKLQMPLIEEMCKPYEYLTIMEIDPKAYAAFDGSKINDMIRAFNNKSLDERRKEMSETKKESFMDKLTAWMEKYVVPVGTKISNQRHLAAVRDGLTILIPASIIGGFACLLAVPPIPATITEPSNFFYAFLLAWKAFAGKYVVALMTPYYLTIGMISIYVVCGVSYQLAKSYKMNAINNMISSLLVYLCVSGAFDIATASLSSGKLGAGYMFTAIIIALLTVEITRFFNEKNITIKLPDSVPPNVAAPFNVLLPLAFNVIVFIIIDKALIGAIGSGIADLIYTIFQPFMKATGSLPSVLIVNVLMTTFWFFGIHGANMLSVVTTPITTAALAANAEAMINKQPLPYIYAGAMNSVFGNWITYTAMLVVIFIFCKSNQARSVAKVAIVPSIFDINEPSIFGLPTVLNVYTYIPLIICSLVNCSTYYLLAKANVVGRFYVTLPFTVPGPLQAFLATGDGKTIILWIILFAVDMVIITPFLKAYDNQLVKQEQENENK